MTEPLSPPTPLNLRKQEAQTLYRQLEECLESNPDGGHNPEALRQMQTTGNRLKRTSSRFEEKIDSLLVLASILYSPDKHRPWDTAHESGSQAVAHFMRSNLVSIRTILGEMGDCP